MAGKQARSTRKMKPKHRAVKPRQVRPLDVAREDNHAARHAAKKAKRAAHEALMARQAEEKAEREAQEKARLEADIAVSPPEEAMTKPRTPEEIAYDVWVAVHTPGNLSREVIFAALREAADAARREEREALTAEIELR